MCFPDRTHPVERTSRNLLLLSNDHHETRRFVQALNAAEFYRANGKQSPSWKTKPFYHHGTLATADLMPLSWQPIRRGRIGLSQLCWLSEATVFFFPPSATVEITSRAETWLVTYLLSSQAGLTFTALQVWELTFYNGRVVKGLVHSLEKHTD